MDIIRFPGLGLEFNISRVAFRIFEIPIYWYGIIIALGFILSVILALRHSKQFGIEQDTMLDVILYSIIAGIVMARVFYVVFSWDDFKDNILGVFNTRRGGLAIYGGLIGAFLTVLIYTRIKKISFFKIVDFGIPYVPLGQAIGRWGNFVNQEAYGTHTELPWGMDGSAIHNGPVHPTFLYESLWNLVLFFILVWFRKRKKIEGEVFFLYMIFYGIGRAWIELMRTDSLMIGNLRVNFLLALLFAVVFSLLLIYRRIKLNQNFEAEKEGSSKYGQILKQMQENEEEAKAEKTNAADINLQEETDDQTKDKTDMNNPNDKENQ